MCSWKLGLVSIVVLAGFSGAVARAQNAPAPQAETRRPPEPSCGGECVRRNMDRAVQACAPAIEAQAPGDFEWLFRPYGTIFQEADTPASETPTVIKYRGDSIRALDPREKWVRVIYECGFNSATGMVAYVRTRLGVLGKPSAVPSIPKPVASAPAAPTGPAPPIARAPTTANASNSTGIDLRRIREPSEVDVQQIPLGAKPPRPVADVPPADR